MSKSADELKERATRFAYEVVCLIRQLPATIESRKISTQLLSAATSVAANYRAACKARSHAEFVAKLGIVVEEADEVQFWLAFLVRTEIVHEPDVTMLRAEAAELTAIFTASHKTASLRHKKR